MKKIKVIAATLATAMLAAAGWSMIACNDDTAFTVTLDANGGAFSDGSTAKAAAVGPEYTLRDDIEAPTREGWTFNGYTVEKDGDGEKIVFGAGGDKFTSSATLYAQWRITGKYMITFDANGGAMIGSSVQMTTDGKLSELPDSTRVSYAADKDAFFYGWWTEPNGGEEVTLDTVFGGDTTVYAYWAKAVDDGPDDNDDGVFTVTFDGNGGTIAGGATAKTSGGKLVALIDGASVEKAGYTFDGWYTEATGGERVSLQTEFTADATVYAHWTEMSTPDPEPIASYEFYLLGTIGKVDKWSVSDGYRFETVEEPDDGVWKQFKVEVELAKGDEVKIFRAKKADVEWDYNNFENGSTDFGKLESNYKVLKSGTFTFYLKLYDNDPEGGDGIDDGSKVYVGWVASATPDPEEPEPDYSDLQFYMIGNMTENEWVLDEQYKLENGEITIELAAGTEFKLATSKADGTTDWSGVVLGGSSVSVGKGYITPGDNIVINKAGTYTIKIVGNKVEITSDDVEEETEIKGSAVITFKGGEKVTLVFATPDWADDNSLCFFVFEQGKSAANDWPGKKIDPNGVVEIDASVIDFENAQIIVYFTETKNGNADPKQSVDTTLSDKVKDGGTYFMGFVNEWVDGKFKLSFA